MSYEYQDEEQEADPHALPSIEVFYVFPDEVDEEGNGGFEEPGWYYWWCLPGCMPDSDPYGPFETEEEALEDARFDE
jgi:hypothetical protein